MLHKDRCFQYAEFRNGFDKDTEDARLVFYGMRYLLEAFIARQWSQQDVDRAAAFFRYAQADTEFDLVIQRACFAT